MNLSKRQLTAGLFLLITLFFTLAMPASCNGQQMSVDPTDYSETHETMDYLWDGSGNVDTIYVDAANATFLEPDYNAIWDSIMQANGFQYDPGVDRYFALPEVHRSQSNSVGTAETESYIEGPVEINLPDTVLIMITGRSNGGPFGPPSSGKVLLPTGKTNRPIQPRADKCCTSVKGSWKYYYKKK